jgi:signal transduction histidine kinase
LRGGLHNYVNGHLSRGFGPADGVASGEVENFAEDHEGRVWIGSNGKGLSVYENGRFRILPPGESPPEHDISGLFVDSHDELWVETDRSGLYRRHNGKWEPFGPERGLNDRLVAGMLEDRAGNLWVSTASSISRIDRRNLEAPSIHTVNLDPIVLDRLDGMVNPEVSGGGFDPTGLLDRDGRLWFSTIDGIAVVDPATFRVNQFAPPVVIESVTSGGKTSTAVAGRFKVAAGGPAFEIRYTGLSLIAPRKVRFRYRIRELSEEWQDAGHNRSVSYPHLPAGNYTFEVLAANNDGIWSKSPAALSIEVAPFWWERLSVRLLALAMLLVATGWAARYLAARRAAALLAELDRQEELTRERRRIARDIHDDLGARLTRMAWMAEAGEKEEAGKLATAAREAIQAMDELVWTVNTRNDTVDGFVSYAISYAEEYLRGARIRVRVSSLLQQPEAELDSETRRHFFLTFKEALNNVVKHAGCSEVRLRFESDLDEISIRVADNGKGFDILLATTSGGGTGVNGMRERAAAMGGRCEIASQPGAGASVYITARLQRMARS